MACACRGNRTSGGAPITSYELTLPSGERQVFLTHVEAKTARRRAGGGTIRPLTA